jgi:hypothetical protein
MFDAPVDVISFHHDVKHTLELEYTFHKHMEDSYHVPVVRGKLTQNIGTMVPDILDEMQAAFADELAGITDGSTFTILLR